jgi:hypothetical protein
MEPSLADPEISKETKGPERGLFYGNFTTKKLNKSQKLDKKP